MLYCLAVRGGDLLDVGGFFLPGPSQLQPRLCVPTPACDLPAQALT